MTTVHAALSQLLPHRRSSRAGLPIALSLKRDALPGICRRLQFRRGAEVGVWKGAYSALFCRVNPAMTWLAVDPWQSYPAWVDPKNSLSLQKATVDIEDAYRQARKRLAPFRHCTIQRAFSVDAAATVQNGSLDVVYIDGNHGADAVTADLDAWVPKVRRGGLIAGHDYRVFTTKPMIQVVEAVQAFTMTHQIDPWFVLVGDRTPSWLWVKS